MARRLTDLKSRPSCASSNDDDERDRLDIFGMHQRLNYISLARYPECQHGLMVSRHTIMLEDLHQFIPRGSRPTRGLEFR